MVRVPAEEYKDDDTSTPNGDGFPTDELITNVVHDHYKSNENLTISALVTVDDIEGTGYTKCDENGKSSRTAEYKDVNEEEKKTCELNVGIHRPHGVDPSHVSDRTINENV